MISNWVTKILLLICVYLGFEPSKQQGNTDLAYTAFISYSLNGVVFVYIIYLVLNYFCMV